MQFFGFAVVGIVFPLALLGWNLFRLRLPRRPIRQALAWLGGALLLADRALLPADARALAAADRTRRRGRRPHARHSPNGSAAARFRAASMRRSSSSSPASRSASSGSSCLSRPAAVARAAPPAKRKRPRREEDDEDEDDEESASAEPAAARSPASSRIGR